MDYPTSVCCAVLISSLEASGVSRSHRLIQAANCIVAIFWCPLVVSLLSSTWL